MKKRQFLFIFIIFIAFLVRYPFVGAGLPYFQNEDEMHHFNRTVRMVQSGSFNPNYFLKPSLHFYMRIPVVALSFIWNVRKGHVKTLSDIKITNPYGIASHSSTASHIGIVKWNRMFSLTLSILTLVLIFFIIKELTNNYYTSVLGSLLFALSPPQIELSTQINVDVPVMFLCCFAVFIAIKTYNKFSVSNLIFLSIISGFAISTKYNAMPIYFLPFFTLIASNKINLKNCCIAFITPIVAFFIASPYAFINYNLFLDHLAFEVKHYGVDGHVGHLADPGLQQLLFYSKWFCVNAIGWIPFICFLYGVIVVCAKSFSKSINKFSIQKHLLVLSFPLLFLTLMIFQRANFTRNMLMALPFVCIFASIGFSKILKIFLQKNLEKKNKIITICILVFFVQVAVQTFFVEKKVLNIKDTRTDVSAWVRDNHSGDYSIFVSGKLDLEHNIFAYPNIIRIDETTSPLKLYNKHGKYLILPKYIKNPYENFYKEYKVFNGQEKDPKNRLYVNPNIVIYEKVPLENLSIDDIKTSALDVSDMFNIYSNKYSVSIKCDNNKKLNEKDVDKKIDKDCWLTSNINKVSLKKFNISNKTLHFSYMNPWQNQNVKILVGDKVIDATCKDIKPWEVCKKEISIPKIDGNAENIYILVQKLISPYYAKYSQDERFLGISVK
ncbi:MAG: ArnT family glycosyltransferase [Bdellovibrionota bacterium]